MIDPRSFYRTTGRIVGLYAPTAQSGKSTVAKVLMKFGYQRMPFAAPVKGIVFSILRQLDYDEETVYEMLYGSKKTTPIPELADVTPRYMMQTVATEWGRQIIDPNIWLRIWQRRLQKAATKGVKYVVVDDMRFTNEAKTIQDIYGGTLIKVVRPDTPVLTHASEGNLNNLQFDYVIENTGTLNDLQAAVNSIAADLKR